MAKIKKRCTGRKSAVADLDLRVFLKKALDCSVILKTGVKRLKKYVIFDRGQHQGQQSIKPYRTGVTEIGADLADLLTYLRCI